MFSEIIDQLKRKKEVIKKEISERRMRILFCYPVHCPEKQTIKEKDEDNRFIDELSLYIEKIDNSILILGGENGDQYLKIKNVLINFFFLNFDDYKKISRLKFESLINDCTEKIYKTIKSEV